MIIDLRVSEKPTALQSLLYELLMLASALLVRDTRHYFKKYEGLRWGPPQIAHDVLRLKSRLILDFFYPDENSKYEEIAVSSFKLDPEFKLDQSPRAQLLKFKKKVNVWTIHFGKIRKQPGEYSQQDRKLMEKYALLLLRTGTEFVSHCLNCGIVLKGWGVEFHGVFTQLYDHLQQTQRIEEGKGPAIDDSELIDLIQRSLSSRTRLSTSATKVSLPGRGRSLQPND